MKTKVAEEVFLHHVLASLVEKHGKCLKTWFQTLLTAFFAELWILLSRWFEIFYHLRHLAVSNEGVVLDVQVPHFHEVLLSGVDVREVVDHLWRLYPQPALEERKIRIYEETVKIWISQNDVHEYKIGWLPDLFGLQYPRWQELHVGE